MELFLAITVGVLYGTGFYLLMQNSMVKLILGLILLSHGSVLLIFFSGGIVKNGLPIIQGDGSTIPTVVADPLSQALILTAIVISFGVLAFALVLVLRAYQCVGSDKIDELRMQE
jgi:multicomponent Na+:H+ antiporter subunit C